MAFLASYSTNMGVGIDTQGKATIAVEMIAEVDDQCR